MAALLFILGLLTLCLIPPLGAILILLAVAWAIVFPRQIKLAQPAKQYHLSGRAFLFLLCCFVAVCVVAFYWRDVSRWSLLNR